jgi:hypothetical protein
MDYGDLIRLYFERSTALQWYWTIYVLVIGGVLAFSTMRLRPELATTILVTLLYMGFAYKNLGAVESTAHERAAVLQLINEYPAAGAEADSVGRLHKALAPAMPPYDVAGARNFHLGCDLLTVILLWVKEVLRRKAADSLTSAKEHA